VVVLVAPVWMCLQVRHPRIVNLALVAQVFRWALERHLILQQAAAADQLLVLLADQLVAAALVEAPAQMVDLQRQILVLVVVEPDLHQMVVQVVQD
jgi:hypothetical protein